MGTDELPVLEPDPLVYFRDRMRGCTACDRRRSAREPVPFSFPLGADEPPRALVVAARPSPQDEAIGSALSGPAGARLEEFLRIAGLSREWDAIVTFAQKCAGPAGLELSPTCRQTWLTAELKVFQPRVVIGLGTEVFTALTGQKFVTGLGEVREVEGKAATFYTYSPASTFRSARNHNAFFAHAQALKRWFDGS